MHKRRLSRPRQQSSLEFITTYSWALLIIALFVAVVAALSLSPSSSQYLPAQCNIAPLLPCLGSTLSYNATSPITFTVQFQNNLGQAMYVPMSAFFVSTTDIGVAGQQLSIGSCNPQFLPSGTQAVCTAQVSGSLKPAAGTSSETKFWVSYQLCTGSDISSCDISASNDIYNTGGISLQKFGQSSTRFYTVTLDTQPSGVIVINGATYASGTSANLLAGNYSVFAQPSLGYTFSSWSVNAPSSVNSISAQGTTLVLDSNTTLVATFNSVTPTTSVTYTSTVSGSSPASSTSSTSSSTSTTSPTSTTTVTTTSTSATTSSTSTYTTTVSSTTYTTVTTVSTYTTVTTVSTTVSTVTTIASSTSAACPIYSSVAAPSPCSGTYCCYYVTSCEGGTACYETCSC